MKITEILMAEHAVFHNLFDHLEKTVPHVKTLAEVKSLAATVETLHRAHANTEDDLFINPLQHCFEQIGQYETFHDEHEEIDQALVELRSAKTLKAGKKSLLTLVAAARNHLDKEERIVFPMAERVLNAKTLTDLGNQWMKRREAALK